MKSVSVILCVLFFGMMPNIALTQGIPQVYVELSDDKNITEINKETKIFANMRIENAYGSNYTVRELYDGLIRIKGRGNSSWNIPDKKSYSIDLVNHLDKKNDVPLLGMPDDADWILYASYFDKTFLRNYFTYHLADAMGHWASRSRFVELFINGDYRGLYIICENVKRGSNRVHVSSIGNSGIGLTGGYILEQDYPDRLQDEGSQYITSSRIYDGRYYGAFPQADYLYFGFKYPKDDERTAEQTQYIKNYIAGFEAALYGSNFADLNEGYRKYIDVNSFVDWFIISELAADWDHSYFLSSCYLTKPQGEKMKIGPVWDFDVGYKTSVNSMSVLNNAPWISRLWEDESFRQLVFDRFVEVIHLIENSLSHIENVATELERRGAIDRNFEKWDILGKPIWTETMPIPGTYNGEIRRLTQWIRQRYLYISTFDNPYYCEVLKRIKPAIRIIDQDVFDNGEFPVQVESSSLQTGVTPYYVWNKISQGSRRYQIYDYGKYSLTIRMGTCESLPSDTLYVKRNATVFISGNEQVYDGTPKKVNVLTEPPSLPVRITYNGETNPPVEPGTYRVDAEIDNAEYRGKQVDYINITIDKKLIVAPTSKNFGTVVEGYFEITPHIIPLIGNADLGAATVELGGAHASDLFEISLTQFPDIIDPVGIIPLTTTVVDGEYRTYIAVRPKTSLPAGTYRATLTFRGDFTTMTVNLDFEVSDIGSTLMIWQIGAGNNDNESNVSHSFVELYNAGSKAVDLSGYSLQYAEGTRGSANNEEPNDNEWKKINLSGTIQPKHSFLILGRRISTMPNPALNIKDNYGDINDPSFRLSNRSVKVVLMSNTELLTVQNPFDIDGYGTKSAGYVDMVGVMNDPTHATNADKIRAFETNPAPRITKHAGVRRLKLNDTDNNSVDFETVIYDNLTAKVKEIKRPKNHAFDVWDPIIGFKVKEDYNMSNVIFEDKTVTYNGMAHSIFISGALPPGVKVLEYNGNNKTDIGTYMVTVYFTVADPDNYNVPAEMTATLTIIDKNGNLLRAWVHSGLLHVTGLTPGKTLNIYSVSGALVYHSIATSVEADILLTMHGVYIVYNDNRTLKVVFL